MKIFVLAAAAVVTSLAALCIPASTRADGLSGTAAPAGCAQRANDTPVKLDACIRQASLWQHLAQFQAIADAHPGADGHGNRDTGTSGYKASVAYVAGLMRRAGYAVTVQPYVYETADVTGTPVVATADRRYAFEREFFVARGSGAGTLTAALWTPYAAGTGCEAGELRGLARGQVAVLPRGPCAIDTQVAHARAAGASAVILYAGPSDEADVPAVFTHARLTDPAAVPVLGISAAGAAADLVRRAQTRTAVHIDVRTQNRSGIDYNLIADSPYGDPNRIVAVDAHLDSIYGAGMLDNASGSTTILEIALDLAKTPTHRRLRYVWFGGEELGLLGSRYYTRHLTAGELRRFAFDIDVDVTATPNFDYAVADPAKAYNVKQFPPNVVPQSQAGNALFAEFFSSAGVISRPAPFGNDGTDSNSFSLVGVPNTGILTMQDCCKRHWETQLWGGVLGNYEGAIPSFNGGCVDMPHRWCDNLSNNDPAVLELASKAVAYVVIGLANATALPLSAP